MVSLTSTLFAVSYSFFGAWTPSLQHAAISASMAIVRPVESLADVDMVDVAWVSFVPRPSAMSTAPSTARYSCPRARAAKLGSDVERVEQIIEDARGALAGVLDIWMCGYTSSSSIVHEDAKPSHAKRSMKVLEVSIHKRTLTSTMPASMPTMCPPSEGQLARNPSMSTSALSPASMPSTTVP